MTDVLRSTTFQLEFKGQDGITGVRQFTRAVTDADEVIEELSKTLGDNTEVTFKNVQSKKELTADGRRLVSQMERTKSKMRELTRLYDHQSRAVNKTADEQEVLNAVYKLGAHATQKQKDEVARLVQTYQKVRTATDKTQGSFRNLRGVSQNLGWQLQDVAVQAQMGTSAFIIFSQQGSQMASSFGPGGALIGAFIAVAGAMAGVAASSDNAKDSAKALKEAKFDLIEVLREQAKELKFLEAAQVRVLKVQDAKILKKLKLELMGVTAALQSSGRNWNLTGKKLKEHNELVDRNRAKQDTLSQKILEITDRMANYNNNLEKTTSKESLRLKSLNDMIKSYELEADSIGLSDRAIVISNANKLKATKLDVNRINNAFDLIEAETLRVEKEKESIKNANKILRLFESERKSVVKQTETIDEQYNRRKSIVDDYVKEVGSVDTKAAQVYSALEEWKTLQLAKEFNKREILRRQIEKAQESQLKRKDATGFETNLFLNNVKILNNQKKLLGEDELDERKRIDTLIEQEVARHNSKMDELNMSSLQAGVATFSIASQQVTALANMMTEGVQQVRDATSEMNAGQKAAFILSQGIAAALAVVNGISLGGKLAEMFPLVAPAMITLGTGLGVANAAAIGAITIAGAFDKGGNIPSGQLGIVSEFGDELVNGQLVKGPAKVTSREDTAKMMNGGLVKVIVENKIDAARYDVQRVDESTVKIIAEQVFSDNIDSGVSGVLTNRNSKSTKAIKSKFNVRSNL